MARKELDRAADFSFCENRSRVVLLSADRRGTIATSPMTRTLVAEQVEPTGNEKKTR